MIKIIINNKLVDKEHANISVLSSFGRGYGVFETLRTYDKKIFQAEEHLKRLFSSAKQIKLNIKYTKPQIHKMLEKISKASPHKTQRIKIITLAEYLIIISTPQKIDKKIYDGVECISIKETRPIPEIKTISYVTSYLAHEKAAKKKKFDAILIDDNEEVYEGAYSNLFWFENETLCTRKDKVLPGITRQTVAKISPFKIKFKTVKLKELLTKKEVFLTTSISGIVPVIKINNSTIGTGKIGEKTLLIIKTFNDYVASSLNLKSKKQQKKPRLERLSKDKYLFVRSNH